MSIVTPSLLSIIILEVNGLTSITQKHRVAEWIIKEDSTTKHSSKKKKTHFRFKDRRRLKRDRKTIPCKMKLKETGVPILLSD